MDTFDVVVVGKGLMGAAAARHLARAGVSVALVGPDEPGEHRTHAGVFASHYDSGRITRTIDADPDWALLARRSIARYGEIEAESGIRFYAEVGCLIAAPEGSTAMARTVEASGRVGAQACLLDATALAAAFPALRFPGEYAALHEARGAGTIDPRALVAAQARLAAAAGARIVAAEVVAVRDRGAHVEIETAEGTTLGAARAVIAAGGFSIAPGLLPRRLDLGVKARTVLFAEVGPEDAARYAAMPSIIRHGANDPESFYVLPPVRYPDGRLRIKIGGDPVDRVLETEPAIRAWFRGEGDAVAAAHMHGHLATLLPDLRPVALTTAPCVTSFTRHGHPYVGFAESERIVVLTGGNGAAAKSSDEIGRLGATLAATGRLDAEGYATDFAVCFH